MMNVNIEIARVLQKINDSRDYDIVTYDNCQYVQIIDLDIPDYDSHHDCSRWEAYAVKIDDDIVDDYCAVYKLIWYLDNEDANEYDDTVNDWEKIDDVVQIGEININNGRIV
jgi:hypothetical protein